VSLGEFRSSPNQYALWLMADQNDSSGNGRTLTAGIGSPVYSAIGGRFSGKCTVDGNDMVYRTGAFDTNADYVVAGWYRIETAPSSGNVYSLFEAFYDGGAIEISSFGYRNNGGTYQLWGFAGHTSMSTSYLTNFDINLGVGVWHFIAMVSSNGVVSLYLNGVLLGNVTTGTVNVGTDKIGIGRGNGANSASWYAKMSVSSLGVWTTAITSQELRRWFAFSIGKLV
jgi:hypothetical protein